MVSDLERISDDDLDATGDPGLDFVNTVVSTGRGRTDLLASPESFVGWIERAGGADASRLVPSHLPDRRTLTAEAVDLRRAVVELFRSVATGSEPPAHVAFVIDRVLRAGSGSYRLELIDGRPRVRTIFEARDRRGSLAALAPIAAAAVEVAHSADPARLRECDAPDCARWFVDTSKGGRRRWCSMARCGNRAKAARYRRRR